MSNSGRDRRVDSASRVILASPRTLFRAFLDAEAMASWRAPDGMTARILAFDPRIGGGYRMVLNYDIPGTVPQGKSGPDEDAVVVRFTELLPDERVVEQVKFLSDDAAYHGVMTLTTSLERVIDGTKVTIQATDVPPGIDPEDHKQGMAIALRNLARLTE